VGLVAQLVFEFWTPGWVIAGVGLAIFLVTDLMVAAWLLVNRRLPGMRLAALGLLLNVFVIAANQSMPVSAWAADVAGIRGSLDVGFKHETMTRATVAPWLGDVIPVPHTAEIFSPGDVVIAAGIVAFVYRTTRPATREGAGTPSEADAPGLEGR
jgi:hypothetical protein